MSTTQISPAEQCTVCQIAFEGHADAATAGHEFTRPATVEPPRVFAPRGVVPVKVGWPKLFPWNKTEPFVFFLRVQLVADAEKIQREFLMQPDVDQEGENLYQYDVEMIAQLSKQDPTGFPDWAEITGELSQEQPEKLLADKIRHYFLPVDQDRRDGMAFIVRAVMQRYWRAIDPADYL